MINLDGGILEGGGQILRISMCLGALLDKPLSIENIRAGRKKPGLSSQHLTGLKLVNDLCSGQLNGCALQSSKIEFRPRGGVDLVEAEISADIGTAGSVCLLAQIALPCVLFNPHPVKLRLLGGTNADFAPQVEYFEHVTKPNFSRFGINIKTWDTRRGYFPKGGGLFSLEANIVSGLQPLQLTDPGQVTEAMVYAHTAGSVPASVAEKMAEAAEKAIRAKLSDVEVRTQVVHLSRDRALGNGSAVLVVLRTTTGCVHGGDGVGSPKRDPAALGQQAAQMALESAGVACVDSHMQDQIIVFMALAEGQSKVLTGPLTLHTKTAIHFAEIMTGAKFDVEEVPQDKFLVTCKGIGHKR